MSTAVDAADILSSLLHLLGTTTSQRDGGLAAAQCTRPQQFLSPPVNQTALVRQLLAQQQPHRHPLAYITESSPSTSFCDVTAYPRESPPPQLFDYVDEAASTMTSSTNHHYNDDNNNNKVVVSRQQSTASSSGYSSSCHRWQSTGDDVDDDNDNDVDRSGGDGRATAAVSRYKTELCRPFDENGSCRYGEKCQFAHGRHELRVVRRHPKYKTDLCRTYHTTGLCPYGPRCHFVHNEDERRRAVQAAAAAGVEKSSSKHAAAAVAQPATAGDRATFEASLQFDQRHKQELALRWALMNGRQQQCEVMSSVDPEHRRRMSSSSSLSSTSPFVDELFETARFQPLVPPQAQRSCFASVDRVGHQQLRQPLAPPPSRNLHRYSFGSLAESPSPPSSFTDSPPPLSPSSLTDDIGLHQQHHRLQHSPPPLPRSHVPCSVSNHDMMTILLLAARLRGLQA